MVPSWGVVQFVVMCPIDLNPAVGPYHGDNIMCWSDHTRAGGQPPRLSRNPLARGWQAAKAHLYRNVGTLDHEISRHSPASDIDMEANRIVSSLSTSEARRLNDLTLDSVARLQDPN